MVWHRCVLVGVEARWLGKSFLARTWRMWIYVSGLLYLHADLQRSRTRDLQTQRLFSMIQENVSKKFNIKFFFRQLLKSFKVGFSFSAAVQWVPTKFNCFEIDGSLPCSGFSPGFRQSLITQSGILSIPGDLWRPVDLTIFSTCFSTYLLAH